MKSYCIENAIVIGTRKKYRFSVVYERHRSNRYRYLFG